jgi:hypothetical protein
MAIYYMRLGCVGLHSNQQSVEGPAERVAMRELRDIEIGEGVIERMLGAGR